MSVRSDILAAIAAALRGITGVGEVIEGRYDEPDLDTLTLPAMFILQGSDKEHESEEFGAEVWDWDIIIETWCQDTAAEALFSAIHVAMATDPTLDGNAIDSRRTGSMVLSLDSGRGLVSMQQMFRIVMSHPNGQP